MLSAKKNRELTEIGPGSPAGALMRRYWHPFALATDLGDKPMAVRLLGEDLVLYRSGNGTPSLIDERCPHRSTTMQGGNIDPRGIRCCYHGWLFDAAGKCLDVPGEAPGSKFAAKVRIKAYPVQEAYDMFWAYMGKGKPPVLPPYDVLARTDGHRRVARADLDCNWLQIFENSMDPIHTAVLHVETDLEPAYGEMPEFEMEETEIGLRTNAWRKGSKYLRHAEVALPTLTRVGLPFMEPAVQLGFWITPLDDTHSKILFSWFLPIAKGTPKKKAKDLIERMEDHMTETAPDDPSALSSRVILQDKFACETQGPIVDRTEEVLARSDRAMIQLRKQLTEAIKAVAKGSEPRAVIRGKAEAVIHFDKVANQIHPPVSKEIQEFRYAKARAAE